MVYLSAILQDHFHCDNQAVVHILNSGTSQCRHLLSLMHYLFYICCKFNIVITAVHIPGLENSPSDALSRLRVARYQELVPQAVASPTPVTRLNLESFK